MQTLSTGYAKYVMFGLQVQQAGSIMPAVNQLSPPLRVSLSLSLSLFAIQQGLLLSVTPRKVVYVCMTIRARSNFVIILVKH